jgi:hypothetical protein
MALFEEINSDADDPEEPKPTDYTNTYLVALAIMLPVVLFFRHIGKFDMGMNVAIVLGLCLFAIRIRWDLRTRVWFWGVVLFVLALHVPLFFLIHWPDGWVPGVALLPIGLADLAVILGAVKFVETFIVKSPPRDEEE